MSDLNGRPFRVNPIDLLDRAEILLDKDKVAPLVHGKCVLVTGGGGSIGSEICRQLVQLAPRVIVVFDIYENTAYELQREIEGAAGEAGTEVVVEIGSVRDAERIADLFRTYEPDVVFHAAAHKHVPLMERNPREAILNNVVGTRLACEAACRHGASRFVLISTDKAVNPTNVMGASKRMCELVVRGMDSISDTVCSVVRFGNVLGSHGSVLPLFESQLRSGSSIKVTHPDIERFFMTIPEASRLVIAAAALAEGGEAFILDMGSPVKILDLAKRYISLAGYGQEEVEIDFIGLRPGEKLYEELLLDSERTVPTSNSSIMVCVEDAVPDSVFRAEFDIEEAARSFDSAKIRRILSDVAGLHDAEVK